jgi:hypothetical protein
MNEQRSPGARAAPAYSGRRAQGCGSSRVGYQPGYSLPILAPGAAARMMATPADIAFLEQLIVGSTGVIVVLLGSILAYVVPGLGRLDGEMRTEFINVRKDISNLAAEIAFIRGQLAPRPEQVRGAEG